MTQHKLVIAEKPSVAQSLAAVIGATDRKDGYLEGNGWRVSWCVGHLAGLADADSYDLKYAKWRYDDLPILPEHWQMVVGKDKKKQFDILKKLMNAPDVTEVVNACDAGREGELIFRSVYELAGCKKPMKRLWISSMEDSAIREGFANLRLGADYDGLRDAALCRAKADWLVGINATRLFSVLVRCAPARRRGRGFPSMLEGRTGAPGGVRAGVFRAWGMRNGVERECYSTR